MEWLVLKPDWCFGKSRDFKERKKLEGDKSFESFRKKRKIDRYGSIILVNVRFL